MAQEVNVDQSRWPIVVCTFAAEVSDAALQQYVEQYLAFVERKQIFAVVNDHTAGFAPNVKQRHTLRDAINDHAAVMRERVACNVVVSQSALVRGAGTAFGWMVKTPYPILFTKTVEEGIAAAQEHLARAAGRPRQ